MKREEAIAILRWLNDRYLKRLELIRRYPHPIRLMLITQAIDMAIEALQVEPKTGKWIIKHGNYCGVMIKEFYCDQCMTRGALRRVFSDSDPLPNFCGHCGADMRGSNNETREEETR